MKPKTRYNIRLALRKGIEVREVGRDGLERWYDLYRHTAQRDRISIHSKDYYEAQFDLADEYRKKGLAYRLLLANRGDETLAGIIVVIWGKTARYLFGASSNRHRNLMPTYAVQWRAIQMAREAGCERYDLFGIPASDEPHHPMHGLYQFKTGFGGEVVNQLGCWDVVLDGLRYAVYRRAEVARRLYHKVLKKRL
jgi:lipid II:glycine glycyltransferase (peptidoglycan interpeptide bridge formation enzyme)